MAAPKGSDPRSEKRELAIFRDKAEGLVRDHPVVTANVYTKWFAQGEARHEEVRHLTVQFSVFSHQFVEAQLRKVINAADLESYRKSKEILMNELGVVFRAAPGGTRRTPKGRCPHETRPGDGDSVTLGIRETDGFGSPQQTERGSSDHDLSGTAGTVEGGRFHFAAAHFEWLLSFGAGLGLGFEDLGKRLHGTSSTLFFCDELLRIYGSEERSVAEGASFAVEHWAAAGFWKELIAGLSAFRDRHRPDLPLGFWTWHDRLEDQHAAHTSDELAAAFGTPGFEPEMFLAGAREMLDAVGIFWDGLWRDHVEGTV